MTDCELLAQALEALETADESAFWVKQESVVKALRERLAQPEQEPVAVVSGYYGGQCVILPIDPARIFNSNTALYTSPPAQRKPLTDEEIEDLYFDKFSMGELKAFARAIEAAHGIKEKNT